MGSAEEYREYIASEKWQRRRQQFRLWHPRCADCGLGRRDAKSLYGEDLHVHHLSYARVGSEKDEDLETLCKACHEIRTFGSTSLSRTEIPKHPTQRFICALAEVFAHKVTVEEAEELLGLLWCLDKTYGLFSEYGCGYLLLTAKETLIRFPTFDELDVFLTLERPALEKLRKQIGATDA